MASAIWVLIAGVVGLVAALTLTVEKIELLIDPAYVPSCSINPVLSCGSVMVTPQASAFGFPNSLIGIVAFTVVVVTGVLAVAKVALPRWYWVGLAIGTLLGTVFVHWLIVQSLYHIGALCPYCMVVWSVTIPLLCVVTSIALQPTRGQRRRPGASAVAVVHRGAMVHRDHPDDPGCGSGPIGRRFSNPFCGKLPIPRRRDGRLPLRLFGLILGAAFFLASAMAARPSGLAAELPGLTAVATVALQFR